MARITMEIVLSDELKQRLEAAAVTQQQSLQVFIQNALYTYVEDIEDGVLSDVALSENGLAYIHPEGERAVGLDHSVLEISRKTA